ncbi:LpqB family beta-propeller domain-containing protein [Nocardioides sp.]|uniref:LpqB family beta-propeller domain-containing protein n=1 Tax=Nocardioides sp. TaxID=35761 RepID=UPI0039E52A86
MRRPLLLLVSLLLGAIALTGCVSMPTSGKVKDAGPTAESTRVAGISIDPRPPRPGASPAEIVQGFLDAMLATPVQTRSAQQFLTSEERNAWSPGQATIIYSDLNPRIETSDNTVSVYLTEAHRLDERGSWEGALPADESTLGFTMAQEDGEWRIASAPNALVVPAWWFEGRFVQLSLYFFDPTGRVLVPEPVFMPRGNQLATLLVRDLVQGPSADLAGVERSFFPAGSSPGLSVPVDADGTAEVVLTGGSPGAAAPGQQALTMMAAQLAWTLRQDPTVTGVRVTLGDRVVQLAGGRTRFTVDDGPEYDPAGYQTSPQMFGLSQDGLLVSGQPPTLAPVPGVFGRTAAGLREVAVDLDGQIAAGVTQDGTRILRAGVQADPGGADDVVTLVKGGHDLLRPAWDAAGRLWVVDNRRRGAQVSYVGGDGQRHLVDVPDVSGAVVRQFLVSRDGSRLVAVVAGEGSDRLVVSRLRSDESGTVLGAGAARSLIGTDETPMRIRDVVWVTPTTVMALHQLSEAAQLRTVAVDGSSVAFPDSAPVVADQLDSLVGSPVASRGTYGLSGQSLVGLTADAQDATLDAPVTALGYVG